MLSDIRYWERKATEGHYAIPHFNVWNAEMLMGVIDAAEELRAPLFHSVQVSQVILHLKISVI